MGTCPRIVVLRGFTSSGAGVSLLEGSTRKGESPVFAGIPLRIVFLRRVTFLGTGAQTGGKFHLKLNMDSRPIAQKYHEGKVKRTLERELKGPELAEAERLGICRACGDWRVPEGARGTLGQPTCFGSELEVRAASLWC